jgi:hypothetical protein
MNATWNLTSSVVADRKAARESAARSHRQLSEARQGHRLLARFRHPATRPTAPATATADTATPTTGPAPQQAAA